MDDIKTMFTEFENAGTFEIRSDASSIVYPRQAGCSGFRRNNLDEVDVVIERIKIRKSPVNLACACCKKNTLVRMGTFKGVNDTRQRYKCKSCGKTQSERVRKIDGVFLPTGSRISHDTGKKVCFALVAGCSMRSIAINLKIHQKTVSNLAKALNQINIIVRASRRGLQHAKK